jgi:hypothetical protein
VRPARLGCSDAVLEPRPASRLVSQLRRPACQQADLIRTGIYGNLTLAPVSLETCGTPSTWKRDDKSLFIPEDLPPGIYRFRVALLDPETSQPAVLLAIKGRQPDGWYDLGSVEVKP